MNLVKFLLTLAGVSVGVSLGSLLWPKLSESPRPEPLNKVREMVIETDLGRQAAAVLGVEEEEKITPINFSSAAANLVGSVASGLEQKAAEVVGSQVVNQLSRQYDQLPASQQQQLKDIICKP